MRDERVANRLTRPLHDPHEVRWCTRATEKLLEPGAGQRRQLRWLEHDAVPRRNRSRCLGQRQSEREVPRADDSDDSEGLPVNPSTLVLEDELGKAEPLGREHAVDRVCEPDGRLYRDEQIVGVGLDQRFSRFRDDQVGKCAIVAHELVRDRPEQGRPAREWLARPGFGRLTRFGQDLLERRPLRRLDRAYRLERSGVDDLDRCRFEILARRHQAIVAWPTPCSTASEQAACRASRPPSGGLSPRRESR